MHFCEMRATPHLTNESEIESKNKIKRRHRNNNQNVAPASSPRQQQQQQQLKIRSKMRQPAPLSCTVGNIMRQLQLPLLPLLMLLCAGLNGLTHVAALKGKLQLHLPHTIPPSPLCRAPREIWLTISAHSALLANGQQILCGNAALPRFPRYLLVSFVVFPFSHCLPHLVVPRFGYFWLQPTALFFFFIYAARSLMDFNVAL